jgi:NTP pyrophosphatase (non-canonical NTP hydrolase)
MNEILVILQEECAEVSQVISKIHRFGIEAQNPDTKEYNIDTLHKEMGDLLCMVEICLEKGILSEEDLLFYKDQKREKLKKWSNIDFLSDDQC